MAVFTGLPPWMVSANLKVVFWNSSSSFEGSYL